MTSSPDQSHRADHEIRVLVGPVLDQIEGGATAPDVRNVRARLAQLS